MSVAIGRNDPCPCGSLKPDGRPKKYKHCCLVKRAMEKDEIIRVAKEMLMKQAEETAALRERGIFINYVKPTTYVNPKTGKPSKAWALGNRLFHSRPEHETFHEFTIKHLRDTLGKDWWEEQLRSQEKHFLFKCFIKYDEWSKKNATEGNRVDEHVWYAPADGWTKTLSSLAFDICSLEHTKHLPGYLLSRLRNRDEYQGAHYEISVAAIFSRLNCKIEFLDDQRRSERHCEFLATHNETKTVIAVEAKSRQRPGVKHREGVAKQEELLRGDVKRLFDGALKQNPKDKPFVIFIDINAPLTPDIPMGEKPWFKDLQNMMSVYPEGTPEKPEEYTAVFFTNFSPHYEEGTDAKSNEFLACIPLYKARPLPSGVFGDMLMRAIENYGFVPNIVENK